MWRKFIRSLTNTDGEETFLSLFIRFFVARLTTDFVNPRELVIYKNFIYLKIWKSNANESLRLIAYRYHNDNNNIGNDNNDYRSLITEQSEP